jgi:hypothetical protein
VVEEEMEEGTVEKKETFQKQVTKMLSMAVDKPARGREGGREGRHGGEEGDLPKASDQDAVHGRGQDQLEGGREGGREGGMIFSTKAKEERRKGGREGE